MVKAFKRENIGYMPQVKINEYKYIFFSGVWNIITLGQFINLNKSHSDVDFQWFLLECNLFTTSNKIKERII